MQLRRQGTKSASGAHSLLKAIESPVLLLPWQEAEWGVPLLLKELKTKGSMERTTMITPWNTHGFLAITCTHTLPLGVFFAAGFFAFLADSRSRLRFAASFFFDSCWGGQ
eukprot:1148251-Pelagomonas_calceolata.AAC.7